MSHTSSAATLASLRRLLLGILLFGLVGTLTELLLTGHDEDVWQMIPLVALGLAILTSLGMIGARPQPASTAARLFQAAMVLLILVGAVGSVLHARGSMEFKLEMDPSLTGLALIWSVLQAKAPPALAPGTLALLGLIGLACTFRLDARTSSHTSSPQ